MIPLSPLFQALGALVDLIIEAIESASKDGGKKVAFQ